MICFMLTSPEAATRGVLQEKVFLEISQNSLENNCVRASFLMLLAQVTKKSTYIPDIELVLRDEVVYT